MKEQDFASFPFVVIRGKILFALLRISLNSSALSQGKELAKSESYGTKEFKAIASTFSKSGADDAKNWKENLSKMERYFTEGTDGMENFMSDMESKGVASWSDDGKWKTTFDDTTKGIEDAANSMGMSTETFLAMFDKIKETGG